MGNAKAILDAIASGLGISVGEITSGEKNLDFNFPEDYKNFLISANGAEGPIGEQAYIVLWNLNDLLEQNEGYNVKELAPELVLFGEDGGGEVFAFDRKSKHIVQTTLIGIGTDPKLVISRSFTDFVENYENRLFKPIA
jgi:hypothetical protein